MIVVDTSAICAILLGEDDADHYTETLLAADAAVMSAATYVELSAVLKHRNPQNPDIPKILDDLLARFGIEIVALTPAQAILARDAYRRYPILNLGDSFAYALAKDTMAPLLFKGDDFGQTDILVA